MFFSVITKNLNWGVLSKNLVTFKRLDGFKVVWAVCRFKTPNCL